VRVVWLARQLEALVSDDGPVAFVGGEAFGVPFVVDALRARQRTAWWALAPHAIADDVAQGNALAGALNGVLEAPLFGEALPYAAHLRTLRRHQRDLRPLWIVLTIDRHDAPVLDQLVDLHGDGYRVAVDWRGAQPPPPGGWSGRCRIHGPEALRLTRAEAGAVVPAGLGADRVEALWRSTEGRFADMVADAQRCAQLPDLRIPGPDGPMSAQRDAVAVAPAQAVRALWRAGDLVEALELAVLAAPELVVDLLRQAGPAYQERGLAERLHLLLSALPAPHDRQERVLEWRLWAALAVGELAAVVADVDAHLAAHPAAELRARRAGTMPHPHGFALAEAAVEAGRTPLTLWQYGRLHPDLATSARVLEESVRLAEAVGTPYDVARNAGALGARLAHLGEFASARAWLGWALQVFDGHQLRDGPRRLQLVNDLAYTRALGGDLAGLRSSLAEAAPALDGPLPAVARLFASTWAAVELAGQRPEAALELLAMVVAGSPRSRHGTYAHQLVRTLHELGRYAEAARVADDAVALSAGSNDHALLTARLARGMVDAVGWAAAGRDPRDGRARRGAADLQEVMAADTVAAELRLPAALHHLLLSGGSVADVPPPLLHLLRSLHPVALHLFSGPPALFQGVWGALGAMGPALRLSFFGGVGDRVGCRVDGRAVDLTPRMAEVALALTLHPDGMSRDALNDFLTPDGRASFTNGGLRGLLTRMRSRLPVTDGPYRWAVPFAADVVEVIEHVAAGRAREAIALWQGPLLPFSDAPGVREARAALEEALRQAALQGRDPDVLYDLAGRLGDDLELWEAAAAALPVGDPRLALALARCRRLAHEYGASAAGTARPA
jgi:tetratricopeptide (TPR) repeat protein